MEPPENTAGAIESAEKIILRWDSTASEEARDRMIFDSNRQEIDRYLQAVDEIQRSMESVTVTDDQNKVNGAIQIAMARLEDEFRNILISHTGPVEAESLVESVRSTPRADSTGVDFPEEDYSFEDSVVSKEVEVEFHVRARSGRIGMSMSSERRLRLPADQRRVTVPVSLDQKARSKIAANAQHLYQPLPRTLESEDSFFVIEVAVDNERVFEMGHFSSLFNGLARSFSIKNGRNSGYCGGSESAESMVKESKKNELILRSSGTVHVNGSNNFASVFSKRGEKGVNQDCFILWEEFGGQEDMMFCGIFDGHGQWGHYVAKRVRETMPSVLLCNWQETLTEASLNPDLDFDLESDKKLHRFNIWKHSYLKTCATVDQDLMQLRKIDSFYSGTTALTIVRQGELLVVANVGDSRAVLATMSDDGNLVPVQLTVDFKPNLPQEAERIIQSNGRVFCLEDEPGVHRVWLPDVESPGLAMSRAFGDYFVKDFGLISVPEVTQRHISNQDQFVVLATDGVWDVVSNQEAVQIVYSTPDRAKSAKRLVEHASQAWKRKRRGFVADDISAICLFFHSPALSSQHIHHVIT